jgi:hypothetical protein
VIQSKIAIGSGGIFGQGFTMGTQKRLAFLPEQHTDFIFAVVGEETGFLGVTVALTLFLVLFMRITQISGRANDSYSSLVAFGLMASWFVHVLVNVGMTLNLMPITGIPLPFFSYGGSFMLASWLAIGVSVARKALACHSQIASSHFDEWHGSVKRKSPGSRGGKSTRFRRTHGRNARTVDTRTFVRSSFAISTSARTANFIAASAPSIM